MTGFQAPSVVQKVMRKGRYMAMSVLCYAAGNYFGAFVTFSPEVFFFSAFALSILTVFYRRKSTFALTLFFLGAASVQIGRIPSPDRVSFVMEYAGHLKQQFSDYIDSILPEGEERAIVKALTIGDKSDVSRSLMNDYKASGAIHLLALSGLHVGVIYKIISIVLTPLGRGRAMKAAKSVAVIALMWGFATVTGLSASISRAVIMITLYELSEYFHSDKDGLTTLATSAFLIMLMNPEAPREIGFQLSFAAMLSIFTVFPKLKQLLATRSRILQYLWNTIAISISCQLTTGVIAYFYFGTFPRYFLITNIIAMPLVSVVMYLTVTVLGLSFIPSSGHFAVEILNRTIALMNEIMSIISGL